MHTARTEAEEKLKTLEADIEDAQKKRTELGPKVATPKITNKDIIQLAVKKILDEFEELTRVNEQPTITTVAEYGRSYGLSGTGTSGGNCVYRL
ncbi:hypothetical protein CCR75_003734 [Bremia lactucae]|uniref:Uncharacterized protein n=1 Tax=Bremia lactucae TaxID=4779 RepID=A0A976IE35_BRELC|nr:hypothetical protein CCR75_003734 [Bremia lactucae]